MVRRGTLWYGTLRYTTPQYATERYNSLVLTNLALWLSLTSASYVAQYLQGMSEDKPVSSSEGKRVDPVTPSRGAEGRGRGSWKGSGRKGQQKQHKQIKRVALLLLHASGLRPIHAAEVAPINEPPSIPPPPPPPRCNDEKIQRRGSTSRLRVREICTTSSDMVRAFYCSSLLFTPLSLPKRTVCTLIFNPNVVYILGQNGASSLWPHHPLSYEL